MFNKAAAAAAKSTSSESTSSTPLRRSSRKHHAPDSYSEVKPRGKMRSASVQEASSRQGKIAIESVNRTLRKLRADCLQHDTPPPDRAVRCVAPPPSPASTYSDHESDYLNVDELGESTDDDMETLENAVRGVSPSTSSVFEKDSIRFSENPSSSETSASPSPCPSPAPQKLTKLGPVRILTDEEKKQVDEALLRQYPPEHYQKVCGENLAKFFPNEKETSSLKADKLLDSIKSKATEAKSTKQTHPAGFEDSRFPDEKPMPWKYLEKYSINEKDRIAQKTAALERSLQHNNGSLAVFSALNDQSAPLSTYGDRPLAAFDAFNGLPVRQSNPEAKDPEFDQQDRRFFMNWINPQQRERFLAELPDEEKALYLEAEKANAKGKATD